MQTTPQFLIRCLGVLALLSTHSNRGWGDEDEVFFEIHVRPLLVTHCVACHNESKHEAGLRLDSRDGLRVGGESGSVIDTPPGSVKRLLNAVRYIDLEMPPTGKLPEESIERLEQWIARGAPWPEHTSLLRSDNREWTTEDRNYWCFQPIVAPSPVANLSSTPQEPMHPIDALIGGKLAEVGLTIAPRADRRTLARRVYLDLLGVPPSMGELTVYLDDSRDDSDAFASVVDRLLQDPRYGERFGRHWLDLVRYAESDGYKQDDFRPTAYRYRDYVIRSLNSDKPYGQFVTEQLAADELGVTDLETLDAMSYLRLGTYEYNQRDVEGQWTTIMNDVTDVTGEVFLGLGYGCARCHDHKFDPLLQTDYYRLQAYFSGMIPRDDIPVVSTDEVAIYDAKLAAWSNATREIRQRIDAIETPLREQTIEAGIEKFPPEVRPAMRKTASQRSTYEKQITRLAFLQVDRDLRELNFQKRLQSDALAEWESLQKLLERFKQEKPVPIPRALTVRDDGLSAAEVRVPGKSGLGAIPPGPPQILGSEPADIGPPPNMASTGRRLALAQWIVHNDNPLSWRVIVNRIWQHHFGAGIVENASDFGRLTPEPTHRELLDFLAAWFVEQGGHFKPLHRLILTSKTYQQQAYPEHARTAMPLDPNNKLHWRFSARRLDAEQIRDSLLFTCRELSPRMCGPSEKGDPSDESGLRRRSIYRRAMRNGLDALLAGFDAPDASFSAPKRGATTTALQSLQLMNSPWVIDRARRLAESIEQEKSDVAEQLRLAVIAILLREPKDSELRLGAELLEHGSSLHDFCHVLLNSNEFLYCE